MKLQRKRELRLPVVPVVKPAPKLAPLKPKSGTVELGLSVATPRAGIPAKASFQAWAQAAFDEVALSKFAANVGMSLRLVGLDEGRALNLQYRNRDYATNVLSFPSELPAGMPKSFKIDWLGDLVVCAPVIAREALEQQKALREHYAHMCVHGVLHLLGLDHLQAADAQRMEALEVQILGRFAIADPYRAQS